MTIILLVVLFALLAWLVLRVARLARVRPQSWEERERARRSVLWLQLAFLLVLLLVALWYWQGSTLSVGGARLNLYCWLPNPAGGVLLEIPWFGALGAILLSLKGVFDNRGNDWDVSYHAWHIARPAVGAAVGVVGFFMFVAILNATGSEVNLPVQPTNVATAPAGVAQDEVDNTFLATRRCNTLSGPPPSGHPRSPDENAYIYFVVAFVLGFREDTFRELVRRVVDVILRPGDG